jgi:hypothetical protein
MGKDDIQPEHARIIAERLRSLLNYLGRLKQRMERRGFSQDDPLYRTVFGAWQAVYSLTVELHYLSCKSGVGKTPKKEE